MKAVFLGLALAALALVVTRVQKLKIESELVVAVIRAAAQLAIVALVIDTVFDHLGLAAVFVLVMFAAASATAGRRLKGVKNSYGIGAMSVAAGSGTALVVLFGFGGFRLEPQFIIPMGGILIGGSMTATTLSGRRVREEITSRLAELEARMSLGVTARYAMRSFFPRSILTALLPVLDQTKNVGLITLPGAFVGMILGGASPVEAAQVQLTVLFSLLGAQSISATVSAIAVGRSFVAPGERIVLPATGGTTGSK